jgi:hypothetical protein
MTRPFTMRFFDPTADNGWAIIRFDPTFDRVPSTGELVTTKELGRQYHKEVCGRTRANTRGTGS